MRKHRAAFYRDASPQGSVGGPALIGGAAPPVNPVVIHAAVAIVQVGKTGAPVTVKWLFGGAQRAGWMIATPNGELLPALEIPALKVIDNLGELIPLFLFDVLEFE
jgi:hypothetical protein